jgi:hypothetical protein
VGTEQTKYDRLYFAVLDAQVTAQRSGEYQTMDRLLELGDNGDESDRFLVDLLDYYLGAAAGEILQELITSKGNKISALLKEKRNTPLNCLPQYKIICTHSIEHRNRRIDEMLEAINKGIVLNAGE